MRKTAVSSIELAYIFSEELKTYADCSPRISIAVVPTKTGWRVVTNGWADFKNPACKSRIQKVEKRLRELYCLTRD
jgi:hypothetical protein